MNKDIRGFITLSGDSVIGGFIDENEKEIKLDYPMQVSIAQTPQGGIGVNLMPICLFAENKVFLFNKYVILTPFNPVENMKDAYINQVNQLKAAESGIVLAGPQDLPKGGHLRTIK